MIFQFCKYITPTAYFTLKNKLGLYIYPKAASLPIDILKYLEKDECYVSEQAKQIDLAYQAIVKGYIGEVERLENIEKLPLEDEYRFTRKYFSSFWVIHTLFLRLITLNNPFKEVNAFLKSKNRTRYPINQKPILYEKWEGFQSDLIKDNPKISIIIPTLNRYEYLKDVLLDLENQDYTNFDVIIVDQTDPFQKEFYEGYDLDMHVIHQQEKALWLARNRAIEMSDAEYLLLYDDDSRIDDDWITNHLKCLDFFKADISSGISISAVGAEVPKDYTYFKHSEQLDTGNVLIKRAVFKKIGLFDRQYEKQRMGDGEYGLRAYLEGFKNISNPYAKRLHLKVGTGGLRQMGLWDGFRPNKWFDPRPIPSILYQYRKYYGQKMAIYSLIKSIPQSIIPYKYKGSKKFLPLAYLILFIIWPLLLIQVYKSWKLATEKLKVGDLIDKLKFI